MLQEKADELVDDVFEGILRQIMWMVNAREAKNAVSIALFFLLVREANTWRSIRVLRKNTPKEHHAALIVDVGTLLRAMLDANLQADFIISDPANQLERATQYLEFEHVERHEMIRKVLRHDNSISNQLNASPLKPEGEKRVQEEFERVKNHFLIEPKKSGGTVKCREKWYKGNLSQLAESAGKQAEYDTFMASFSGCVHSSAFAVRLGPNVPVADVLLIASKFAARVAKVNIDYNQLDIGENRTILVARCQDWFE